MGKTGETYLVGPDKLMRSDSQFSDESTIFRQEVDTNSSTKALAGGSGVNKIIDYQGMPALSAYKSLEIPGVEWVIIAEIDEAEAFTATDDMRRLALSVITVAGLIVVLLAFSIATGITNPIILITESARRLSIGDVELKGINARHMKKIEARKDELGAIGRAFHLLIDYFKEMTAAAQHLANGDLTVEVEPKSESDTLGNAFSEMILDLRKLVGEVSGNAHKVAAASAQLSIAAEQAGEKTHQIANSIQQVTQGVINQNESTALAAASVDELSRAIEGVAAGAQEQNRAVSVTNEVTHQMTFAIQQVASNAQSGAEDAAVASRTTREGSLVVESAVKSIQMIEEKMKLSETKVHDMGKRSEQIGAIVGTIDDIAAQTKMLALNAAIEAAQAGENGKGFAVVAAEVRKLANKSATATKEIAGLIRVIQSTIKEAVAAMDEGAQEIDLGVKQANEAGYALKSILQAFDKVDQQVGTIATAAEQMKASSGELVQTMESVSSVVEENIKATEEMTASSNKGLRAVGQIASVSKQNSAAAKAVSSATEEMYLQVEEVSASATSLKVMAEDLMAIVSEFKLTQNGDSGR